MTRKIYYLIQDMYGQPTRDCLAEIYVGKEIKINSNIIDPLSRILTVLKNIQIEKDGRIANLTKIGENTYCIVDKNYINPITHERIQYQIIKKINLYEHVYEIRFLSEANHQLRNCRIFFTFHLKEGYIVWSHGFTKLRKVNKYYGKSANEITNLFGQLAEWLFRNINDSTDIPYIGKEGERHEVG